MGSWQKRIFSGERSLWRIPASKSSDAYSISAAKCTSNLRGSVGGRIPQRSAEYSENKLVRSVVMAVHVRFVVLWVWAGDVTVTDPTRMSS